MGPDHSQLEIYSESKHGALFAAQRERFDLSAAPKKLTTANMVKGATDVVASLRQEGYLTTAPFDEPIEFIEFDVWHYYGRTAKHGAFMGGADFVQWHGNYELLKLWLLLLALGGFMGNFALSVLDHAQNGFFHLTEWIPVASAAFAVGFLIMALVRPGTIAVRVLLGVMALQMLVGLAGFVLHVGADLRRPATRVLERFVFGAPAFAPMLFADLALLAAIGVWASGRAGEPPP